MPPFAGLLSIWLVLLVAGTVSNRGVIPLSGLAYFGVVLMIAIALTLSYVADRLLASKLAGLASTLIFPLACVAVEFINTRTSPFGSWGSVAYTQYGNLPLMQLASVKSLRSSSKADRAYLSARRRFFNLPGRKGKRLTIGAVDGVAGFRRLVADGPRGEREFSC
jgi:hypothetical protein